MSETNFLIGRGELLTHDIKIPRGGAAKAEVYTFTEARQHLAPQFESTAFELDLLPDLACPHDYGVAKLTLNPGYIAKSYFPIALLRSIGLESVGSRNKVITPRKWSKKGSPCESATTELFVAGKRSSFRQISSWTESIVPDTSEARDLTHIEDFSIYLSEERVRSPASDEELYYEVGIHLLPDEEPTFIQKAFTEFADSLGFEPFFKLSFQAGNLWFIPVKGDSENIGELSMFSFLRVIRPVPKLRGIRPMGRTAGLSVSCDLPSEGPISDEPRVAILDGGLPGKHPIGPWLNSYRQLDPDASDDPDCLDHGLAVTSAFLFGPLQPNGTANRPYAPVDHYRVLDDSSASDDSLELYRTLGFIEQVLLTRQYEFINLSLGPDLPIEDHDVHAWTSVVDELLSDGDTFMTVAGGNNGERDHESGNARVQVPSDCVNAIAVGAASETEDSTWVRASYSAIGPGRSPGVVKPDLMAFGGDASGKYFHVLTADDKPNLGPQLGTSFASPYLLRSAVGVRAVLGGDLTPLAIKALLVHAAEPKDLDVRHVGWGKIPEDLDQIITCPPGVARIVYRGDLKPGKYLRAQLPLPDGGLQGMIRLKATFCYSCPVDPQDASAYTRAGLDIVFRPKSKRIKAGKKTAETKSFFSPKKYATEQEQRSDFGKWETVLHGDARMRGSSLEEPIFDIHYNAREFGGKASRPEKIPYALIITIEATKHADLYNDILRTYANILTPIQPQVVIPIQT
jgi:hypothetical protein